MTLFTKRECSLCEQLKRQFDLSAMQVNIEVLGTDNADSLAHLAWHGLVEKARKTLPLLVRDDSTAEDGFSTIEEELKNRAEQFGVAFLADGKTSQSCQGDNCVMN